CSLPPSCGTATARKIALPRTRVRLSRLGLLGKMPAACRSRSGALRPCRPRSLTIRPTPPQQEGGGPFRIREFGKGGRLPTLHGSYCNCRTVQLADCEPRYCRFL